MIRKYAILILFMALLSVPTLSHDRSEIWGIITGIKFIKDNEDIGFSPDFNYHYWLFNMGLNSNVWSRNPPDYNLFIGIGILQLLQIQYGTNFSNNIIRIRTDILFLRNHIWDAFFPFYINSEPSYKRLTLNFSFEKKLEINGHYQIGLGFGYYF